MEKKSSSQKKIIPRFDTCQFCHRLYDRNNTSSRSQVRVICGHDLCALCYINRKLPQQQCHLCPDPIQKKIDLHGPFASGYGINNSLSISGFCVT
jgi:hypothetical protein